MTKIRKGFALCLALAAPLAAAAEPDPLWLRAQEAVRAHRDLVASEISVDTVVTDLDGKNLDTIKKSTRLSGWRGQEPVRSTVSLVESQKSGLGELKFPWGVADQPDDALAGGHSVVRSGPATLDGKPCVQFQVQGMKGKLPFKSTVWIEEASGLPVRADYAIEGIPMAKSVAYSILFGRDEQARWLPLQVKNDATVASMLFKFRIRSAQQLSKWVKRPQ